MSIGNIIFAILGFYWLMLCGSQSTQSFDRISEQQREQLSDLNRNGVCLIVWTRLNADSWDDWYMDNFLRWMRNSMLQSIARQCTDWSPCPLLALSDVILRIEGENEVQNQKLIKWIEAFDRNIFWYINPTYQAPGEIHMHMDKTVGPSNCSWVSYVYIDADDVFLDGFFHYITSEITKQVIKRGDVRGALFIPQHLPNLVIGNNKCTTEDFEGYSPDHRFWCGFSSGQGVMLKRDIWNALRSKVLPHFLNLGFLRRARNFIMWSLHMNYTSNSCNPPLAALGHSESRNKRIHEREEREAADTGLFLIDVTKNWRASGIMVHTPFSGHYPWAYYNELKNCTKTVRNQVIEAFPADIDWVLDAAEFIHVSMQQACDHNRYMAPGVRERSRCLELLPTVSNVV